VTEEEWTTHRPAVFGAAYRLLGTVAAHRAYDVLRSAPVRRETYTGPWLPEPLLTGAGAGAVSSP
jgi:hypothetical protein